MTTFAQVLTDQLRREPGRPLITFYDHATGERTELSVTTYANWVAKAAGLLAEEGDLERGMTLRMDLPPHWMGPVFLGAAWTLGLTVAFDDSVEADGVVCGPESVGDWAASGIEPVFACSLDPLGRRFPDPVPSGVLDVGAEIWSQPDAFTPWDPPTDDDVAVAGAPARTQAQEMQAAAAGTLLTDGGRLFTVANPASPPGMATFTEPLARGGSLVLLRNLDPERAQRVMDDERVTHRFGPDGASD